MYMYIYKYIYPATSGITVVGSGVDHASLVEQTTAFTSSFPSSSSSLPSSAYIGGESRIKAVSPHTYVCIGLPATSSATTDVRVLSSVSSPNLSSPILPYLFYLLSLIYLSLSIFSLSY